MGSEKVLEAVGANLKIGSTWVPCYVSMASLGVNGGEPIDNTCLSNTDWKTKQPQTLKEAPPFDFTFHYHPEEWDDIVAEVNVNQLLEVEITQGANPGTLAFWGYLQRIEANEAGIGEPWNGTGTIVPTQINASAAETAPTWTPAP